MDKITIKGLSIDTIIGIEEWERQTRQTVVLDIELGTDIARAAAYDKIEHALDYSAIAKQVSAFVSESQFFLIETLAEKVAALLAHDYRVPWLRLRVRKPGAVAEAEDVAVVIERDRRR